MAAILSSNEIKLEVKRKRISLRHLVMCTNPSCSRKQCHVGKDSKFKLYKKNRYLDYSKRKTGVS